MNAIKVKRQIDKPLAQTPTTRTLLLALGLIVIFVLAVSNMLAQGRECTGWCLLPIKALAYYPSTGDTTKLGRTK